jgi:hypothetical protein
VSVVRLVRTAYPGRVETWECLVPTSVRREYVLVTYVALSTQCQMRGRHLRDKW